MYKLVSWSFVFPLYFSIVLYFSLYFALLFFQEFTFPEGNKKKKLFIQGNKKRVKCYQIKVSVSNRENTYIQLFDFLFFFFSIDQSINQSIKRPNNQPINQSINHSITQFKFCGKFDRKASLTLTFIMEYDSIETGGLV